MTTINPMPPKLTVVEWKPKKGRKTTLKNKGTLKRKIKSFAAKDKKPKKTTLKKADALFSKEIRERDGKCMHPHCICNNKMLQNSHYFGRAIKSTRYDPDNCDTLGWLCHYKNKLIGFEYQKQTIEKHGFDGQYTLWKKHQLRPERFKALCERAKTSIKQQKAIDEYMARNQNIINQLKEI